MQKILIVDKDGTLTVTKSGAKFVNTPDDQKIIPGAGNALTYAKKKGYKIAVASNQGGVIAGYKTDRDAIAEFNYVHQLFPEIDFSVWCPDYGDSIGILEIENGKGKYRLSDRITLEKEGDIFSPFRKPESGMLEYILDKCNANKSEDKILYVGDRPEDKQAAMKAEIMFVWADVFRNDYQRFL